MNDSIKLFLDRSLKKWYLTKSLKQHLFVIREYIQGIIRENDCLRKTVIEWQGRNSENETRRHTLIRDYERRGEEEKKLRLMVERELRDSRANAEQLRKALYEEQVRAQQLASKLEKAYYGVDEIQTLALRYCDTIQKIKEKMS